MHTNRICHITKLSFFVLSFIPIFSLAQSTEIHDTSAWESLIIDYHINDDFYLKNEAHFRRTNFLSDWQQFLVRPSIHYKLNENIDISTGYSFAKNYRPTRDFNENNVWQQLQLSHKSGASSFKHRFRFEERFIDQTKLLSNGEYVKDDAVFTTRFRYRFTWSLPLVKVTENQKLKLTAFDEIWLNTGKGIAPKSVNQNWFYVGVSYPIIKKGSLGIGFLSDYAPSIISNTFRTNNILQTTLKYHIN